MRITIQIVEDLSASTPSDKGFLKVRRLRLRNHREDGGVSEIYPYDAVDREALDAVVMVLHTNNPDAPTDPLILVRQALRPPAVLRKNHHLPVPDERDGTQLWELPAGLIEPDETGLDGIRSCAARETMEETGYRLDPTSFQSLGAGVFLTPGICPEKVHFVHARIPSRDTVEHATLDGSEVEAHAVVEFWPLSTCLKRSMSGEIEDAKTELGLRRFAALHGVREEPSPHALWPRNDCA